MTDSAAQHDLLALRVIDANLNRAREALRVMEDFARFALDDAILSKSAKQLRHDLQAALPATLSAALPAARGIRDDVGRDISTDSEQRRNDVHAVVIASAKRLSEALRSLEEYGKTMDAAAAGRFEALRYRGYELEQALALRTSPGAARMRDTRLYVIVTEALCRHNWFETAKATLAGGADCLQLREKSLPDAELLQRATRLAALCRQHGKIFIVNDRPDIARLSHADGVHVGQDDVSVSQARQIVGADAIVGISTHNDAQIREAIAATPSYIAVGPMFDTSTKPQDHLAGPDTLALARSLTSLPLVAIGGIAAHNAASLQAVADCCLCACSAIVGAEDVRAATRRFLAQPHGIVET